MPQRRSGATESPRHSLFRDYRALIASLLAISALSACNSSSGSDGEALTTADVAARYGYNVSTATLSPAFALVPEYKDPNDGYARDLLAEQCLRGVVEYRAVKPGTAPSLIDERTGQLTFNEEIAAQWGYPQFRLPNSVGSAVPDNVEITPAITDAMRQCGGRTDKRLGAVPARLLSGIEDAGWDAVGSSAEVQQATVAWRTCMAPAGVIDLPNEPNEMPPASVVNPTRDSQGNETDTANIALSDREREVAMSDARCRAEVDYDGVVLRTRAEVELAAIGRDIQGFEAGRRAYQEYEKKIDEVITELG